MMSIEFYLLNGLFVWLYIPLLASAASNGFNDCGHELDSCQRHSACSKLWIHFQQSCPTNSRQCVASNLRHCYESYEYLLKTSLPLCKCSEDHKLHSLECHQIQISLQHNHCLTHFYHQRRNSVHSNNNLKYRRPSANHPSATPSPSDWSRGGSRTLKPSVNSDHVTDDDRQTTTAVIERNDVGEERFVDVDRLSSLTTTTESASNVVDSGVQGLLYGQQSLASYLDYARYREFVQKSASTTTTIATVVTSSVPRRHPNNNNANRHHQQQQQQQISQTDSKQSSNYGVRNKTASGFQRANHSSTKENRRTPWNIYKTSTTAAIIVKTTPANTNNHRFGSNNNNNQRKDEQIRFDVVIGNSSRILVTTPTTLMTTSTTATITKHNALLSGIITTNTTSLSSTLPPLFWYKTRRKFNKSTTTTTTTTTTSPTTTSSTSSTSTTSTPKFIKQHVDRFNNRYGNNHLKISSSSTASSTTSVDDAIIIDDNDDGYEKYFEKTDAVTAGNAAAPTTSTTLQTNDEIDKYLTITSSQETTPAAGDDIDELLSTTVEYNANSHGGNEGKRKEDEQLSSADNNDSSVVAYATAMRPQQLIMSPFIIPDHSCDMAIYENQEWFTMRFPVGQVARILKNKNSPCSSACLCLKDYEICEALGCFEAKNCSVDGIIQPFGWTTYIFARGLCTCHFGAQFICERPRVDNLTLGIQGIFLLVGYSAKEIEWLKTKVKKEKMVEAAGLKYDAQSQFARSLNGYLGKINLHCRLTLALADRDTPGNIMYQLGYVGDNSTTNDDDVQTGGPEIECFSALSILKAEITRGFIGHQLYESTIKHVLLLDTLSTNGAKSRLLSLTSMPKTQFLLLFPLQLLYYWCFHWCNFLL